MSAVSGGLVGLITVSPHWAGSAEFIAAVVASGTRVAIGHTHADAAQLRAAVDAGASLSTHLGNGAHAQLPRHPNYLWAQLAEDRLQAGFIADGHHLPVDTFVAMVRAKGIERSFLVSDSVAVGAKRRATIRRRSAEMWSSQTTDGYSCGARRTSRGRPRRSRTGSPGRPERSPGRRTHDGDDQPARIINSTRMIPVAEQIQPGTRISDVITFDWQPGDRRCRSAEQTDAGTTYARTSNRTNRYFCRAVAMASGRGVVGRPIRRVRSEPRPARRPRSIALSTSTKIRASGSGSPAPVRTPTCVSAGTLL